VQTDNLLEAKDYWKKNTGKFIFIKAKLAKNQLHAYQKKSQKIPSGHIQKAIKRKKDFINRYGGE